jgi:cell fate (sporulation/competence/biofilm development) regulator YmcA (YheA/YmcA/DUF963 family)
VHYRHRETVYHITVLQAHAAKDDIKVTVDGIERDGDAIPLVDDHKEHLVEVRILVAQSIPDRIKQSHDQTNLE